MWGTTNAIMIATLQPKEVQDAGIDIKEAAAGVHVSDRDLVGLATEMVPHPCR